MSPGFDPELDGKAAPHWVFGWDRIEGTSEWAVTFPDGVVHVGRHEEMAAEMGEWLEHPTVPPTSEEEE